jgi:O-acetyl-ADP-ribose deacetylase (regulator of RNase III)
MIEIARGNLLEADAEALVNTVNCVGFMGKGIALQFKQAFPANFRAYEAACRAGEVVPGRMFIFDNSRLISPRYIINFPTKRHWRGNSRLADIRSGLKALIADVRGLGIRSIAVPPLGCGLGGLDWGKVRPIIVHAFSELPDVRVLLFEPVATPDAKLMPIRTDRPRMTSARALFIKLMDAYAALEYSRTLLEVHKLAYFLQEAGEPLHLKYEAGHYGPYAANLNKVLEVIEGHFIRGYGDQQKPDAEIELLPGAVEEATNFLAGRTESLARLERVARLIEGFETPYGMELLATVHWVRHLGGPGATASATSPEAAITQIHAWNPRKQQVFQPEHIRVAWRQLEDQGWMKRFRD